MVFKKMIRGFGSASNRWMSFASASDFMIVILPMRINFLFYHCLQTPSTFFYYIYRVLVPNIIDFRWECNTQNFTGALCPI